MMEADGNIISKMCPSMQHIEICNEILTILILIDFNSTNVNSSSLKKLKCI